jgi:hypothetical protein
MGYRTEHKDEAKEVFMNWLSDRKNKLIQELEDVRLLEVRTRRSDIFD